MKKRLLFYLCGTDGVGKSPIAKELIEKNNDTYVVLPGKIINVPSLPEHIGKIKRRWNDMCFSFSEQSGRAVIVYNDYYITDIGLTEKQLEDTHFITLVCEESVLKQRFYKKWGDVANQKVVGSNMTRFDMAVTCNQYHKKYHEEQNYKNKLLIDTTNMTFSEVAEQVFSYVQKQIDDMRE